MTATEILTLVAQGKLTPEAAAKQINECQRPSELRCKVSEKKAVSVYGLQRMPVTLYAEQWARLIAYVKTIETFIEQNKGALSYKAK